MRWAQRPPGNTRRRFHSYLRILLQVPPQLGGLDGLGANGQPATMGQQATHISAAVPALRPSWVTHITRIIYSYTGKGLRRLYSQSQLLL
jgi:hypothetical protein